MGVLRILNEALTQLHPNGWTTMRAFRALFLPVIGKNFFSDSAGNPLFPFYWQQCPRRYDKYPKKLLRANEW
ncbi:hypothetical protein JHK82_025161 [Glycine max]|nr:hypothetical protein JHK82_025161 [Glycine max]